MSKTTFDNITRSALWSVYNNTCFYCNQLLNWNDLHIDHIIPEYLREKSEEFNEIKIDFGLDTNFDLNELYNLVPSHSKCNLRKSNNLFSKSTTLFYLGLTFDNLTKIKDEIEKLKRRKNKGLILSKLQSALATNLINPKELKDLINEAEANNWNRTQIKLPTGVEFIDNIYDVFYLNSDFSVLLDKKLVIGNDSESLELRNDEEETKYVSTINEWKDAVGKGFYPYTTYAIKMSSSFTYLEEFMEAIKIAKMPKVSFISEPWIALDNLDNLSPSIIYDFENTLVEYINKGLSIGDLVREGIIRISKTSYFEISLEYYGFETSLIEEFRADFNNDGIEDIFVRGYTRAVNGTFGAGFTKILTKYSDKHLIEEAQK